MTLQEAIQQRHSVRRYQERPLEPQAREAIEALVNQINSETGLNIQLITDEPRAFKGVLAYGKFSGVTNYLVMAGPRTRNLDEQIGYHGERLVLMAQTLGLNSCWAGLTYRKIDNTYTLRKGDRIVCYIALGYGITPGNPHKGKTAEQVSNVGPDSPAWFRAGMDAALLAPTAINQQKFRFELVDGSSVRALPGFSLVGYTHIDLGIAKLHFTLGAEPHRFEWVR